VYIIENILPSPGENIAVVFWVEKYDKGGREKEENVKQKGGMTKLRGKLKV
jgi:hypothetical protein